jgi:hypothetical protein
MTRSRATATNDAVDDPRNHPPARAPWAGPNPILTYATEYLAPGFGVPRTLVIALDTRTLEVAASLDGVRLGSIPDDIRDLAYHLDGGKYAARAHDLNLI